MDQWLQSYQPDPNELTKLDRYAAALLEEAQEVARGITSMAKYQDAANWCKAKTDEIRLIDETSELAQTRDTLHKLHKTFCGIIKSKTDALQMCITNVVGKAMDIFEAQEKERRDREADRRAKAATKREEDLQLERAMNLAKHGRNAEAEAALAKPIQVPVPKAEPVEAEGMHKRERWTVDKLDPNDTASKLALVIAVRDGHLPLSVLDIDYGELNRLANSYSGKFMKPVDSILTCRLITTKVFTAQRKIA